MAYAVTQIGTWGAGNIADSNRIAEEATKRLVEEWPQLSRVLNSSQFQIAFGRYGRRAGCSNDRELAELFQHAAVAVALALVCLDHFDELSDEARE